MAWRWAAGAGCVAMLALPAAAGPDETSDVGLETSARGLFDAIAAHRAARALPAPVWSEILAVAVREHAEHLIALGWREGPVPPGALTLDARLAGLHGCALPAPAVMAWADPAAFVPGEVVKGLVARPELGPLTSRPEVRLTGCAVRPHEGRWLCVVAAIDYDSTSTSTLHDMIRPWAEKARGKEANGRHAAIRALGEMKIAEVLPAMREALRRPEPETRAVAAESLGRIASRGAVPPLLFALRDAAEPVRSAAAASLALLTGGTEFGTDADKWDAWWRTGAPTFVKAVEFAAPTGAASDALADLAAAYEAGFKPNDIVRRYGVMTALRTHASRTTPPAQKLILRGLADPDRTVKAEAMRAAAAQKLLAAIGPVGQIAKGDARVDKGLAQIAWLTLGQIGDPRTLELFTKAPVDYMPPASEVLWCRIVAVKYVRAPGSVDWLIGLTTAMPSKATKDYTPVITESLEFLTGEGLAQDLQAWRKWWKGAKDRCRPEPLPEDYEVEGWYFKITGADLKK